MKILINAEGVLVTNSQEATLEFNPNSGWNLSLEHAANLVMEGTEQFVLNKQVSKTSQAYVVYITQRNALIYIKYLGNPLDIKPVPARILTETRLDMMTAVGAIKIGETEWSVESVDKGKVVIFEDSPTFKKLEFQGTQFCGTFIFTREPETSVWLVSKVTSAN